MKIKPAGFTLIELLITVAIVGIVSAIAFPSYSESIRQSKRKEAQAALLSLANAMEMYRMQNGNKYTSATVGSTGIFTNQVPVTGGTKTYTLSISTLTANTYTLSAVPVQPDSLCGTLSYTNTGAKSPSTSGCW